MVWYRLCWRFSALPEGIMFPTDYERAAEYTEQLEHRMVDRLSTGTPVSRRTILGGPRVAGSAVLTSVGRSRVSSRGGHDDTDGGNFGANGEYAESRFDLITSSYPLAIRRQLSEVLQKTHVT